RPAPRPAHPRNTAKRALPDIKRSQLGELAASLAPRNTLPAVMRAGGELARAAGLSLQSHWIPLISAGQLAPNSALVWPPACARRTALVFPTHSLAAGRISGRSLSTSALVIPGRMRGS